MPKLSIKSNHHSQQNGNQISHLDDASNQCNNNNNNSSLNGDNNNTPPHLQHKDAAKRLKRKLRLQEMRCNLMSTKMSELKTALSAKKRQLRISVKKAKDEEKKRRDEEKKLKDMEKEFHRLRKENVQIKENLARNQSDNKFTSSVATATTPTLTHQPLKTQPQPQASTSNSTLNNNDNTNNKSSSSIQPFTFNTPLSNASSVPNSTNKNANKKKNKRNATVKADDSPQETKSLVNHLSVPMIIGTIDNKMTVESPSKPLSAKDLRINEGASCSGITMVATSATITTNCESSTTNAIRNLFGTSKLEDFFENELMCPICHELYIKPVALSCTHIFCSFCIEQWRKKSHKCPICRNAILTRTPQNVLEGVIDKVVTTMDEESRKRRSEVVKDRPAETVRTRSRHEHLINALQDHWREYDEDDIGSDSNSESDSYMPSFSSNLPAYGAFADRSDSELDSSEDAHYNHYLDYPDEHYDESDDWSGDVHEDTTTGEEEFDEDEYSTADDSGSYEDDFDHDDFDEDEDDEVNQYRNDLYAVDSSESSWESEYSLDNQDGTGVRHSFATINSDSDETDYGGSNSSDNSFYSNNYTVRDGGEEEEDEEDIEDEDEDEEDDNTEEEENFTNEDDLEEDSFYGRDDTIIISDSEGTSEDDWGMTDSDSDL